MGDGSISHWLLQTPIPRLVHRSQLLLVELKQRLPLPDLGRSALRKHWQIDPAASEDAVPVRSEELAAVVEEQQSRLDSFGLDEELELVTRFVSISTYVPREQEEFALWASVEGNSSMHDMDGTIGQGLTVDIAKSLSFVTVHVMLVLPTLTQRLLNKKKEKVHL